MKIALNRLGDGLGKGCSKYWRDKARGHLKAKLIGSGVQIVAGDDLRQPPSATHLWPKPETLILAIPALGFRSQSRPA